MRDFYAASLFTMLGLLLLQAGSVNAADDVSVRRMPEEFWIGVTDNLPHVDFARARNDFIEQKSADAVPALRRAAAYLEAEAYHARDDSAAALRASAQEIGGLADRIQAHTLRSVAPLDEAVARAHAALANRFLAVAEDAAKKDPPNAPGATFASPSVTSTPPRCGPAGNWQTPRSKPWP